MGKLNINYNFRKAHQKDREEMLQISYDLGQDYLPRVIDKWLDLDRGGFYLLEDVDNGCIVGYCILKFPTTDQAWLAGMRVRLDYQNLGVGSVLTVLVTEQAGSEGAKYIRLATTFDNFPAQKVGEKYHFYKQSSWRIFFMQEFTQEICSKVKELQANASSLTNGPDSAFQTNDQSTLLPVNWIDFDDKKYSQAVTGQFEIGLETGRRMLFTTDFSFLGLTDSEYRQISDHPPVIARVGDEESVLFVGHDSLSKEGEPVFTINRILFTVPDGVTPEYTVRQGDADKLPFAQMVKSLLVDLKFRGYWGFTIAFPYDLWEQYYQQLREFFPIEEGNSFYVMERYFHGQ